MPKSKNIARQKLDKILTSFGVVVVVTLLVVGGLCWWAYSFTTSTVRSELVSQKIYFPPKGSPALSPKEFPDLQKYAGQQVDNGPKAKAFADGFIGRHLEMIGGGQTYAEVSAKAMADPTNTKLQAEKATLFQGETLRGMLLGNAYAFWTVGYIAKIVAIVAFVAAGLMLFLVLLGLGRIFSS